MKWNKGWISRTFQKNSIIEHRIECFIWICIHSANEQCVQQLIDLFDVLLWREFNSIEFILQ